VFEFKGVFTQLSCASLRVDRRKYTLRDLRPRYLFCGVRIHPVLDEAGDDTVDLEQAVLELVQEGVVSCLALSCATFGGPIEYLAGFEIVDAKIVPESRFEFLSESLDDDLTPLFISKLSAYGLPPEPNGSFFPFESRFWDE
jgi:hypothetical protein